MKKYLVTNKHNGTVSLVGRTRIEIPAQCEDVLVSFPDDKAEGIIAGLKQRHPLLKFKAVKEGEAVPEPVIPVVDAAKVAAEAGAKTAIERAKNSGSGNTKKN